MLKYLYTGVHTSRVPILISNKLYSLVFVFVKCLSSKSSYFQPGNLLGDWSEFERDQNISSGSIEWNCAADATTIRRSHDKALTQREACHVDFIAKAEDLFVNWVEDHLKRLWCSSGEIRCITDSFVLKQNNGFGRSLRYCYM